MSKRDYERCVEFLGNSIKTFSKGKQYRKYSI